MTHRNFSLFLLVTLSLTFGACAVFTPQPVAPQLAKIYGPAMVYKKMCEYYKDVIAITQQQKDEEQCMELLLECIGHAHFYEYLRMLMLDIQTLERLVVAQDVVPKDASWVPGAMKALQQALQIVQKCSEKHASYYVLACLHVGANSVFAREFAFIKSRQQDTLVSYMRGSRTDYPKELPFWKERLQSGLHTVGSRYPHLIKEVAVVLKQIEHLKTTYEKS